jgi:hypothetical protein
MFLPVKEQLEVIKRGVEELISEEVDGQKTRKIV